ncbi:AAC(3) family N-acetyltransferase [Anaerolineales bacterium]
MPEQETINENYLPLSREMLTEQLAAAGLAAGQSVLVHSSLSRLGWVIGAEVTVIQALLSVLGTSGTLMMPTHSASNTCPAHWQNPPVPKSWWPMIQAHMPAYDARFTPTREMGRIAETFRCWPGVLRSEHPIGSFAALGPAAKDLLHDHQLEDMFGERSPIGRLYEADGYIALLGVLHENNTSLHLAEYRADYAAKHWLEEGTAMYQGGQREWVTYSQLSLETDDFNTIGNAYEAQQHIPLYMIGQATLRFMKQAPLVDFAVDWMNEHRE